MKKESVVILAIVVFVAGFVVGAISGIRFYAKEHRDEAVRPPPAPEESTPQAVSGNEISQWEAVVSKEPKNLRALISLGDLYFDSHQPQKAIAAYQRALAIDPRNPDVRTDLGIMYRETKDYDRAVKEFREAASMDASHKNSRFNLAIVLQQDKKDIPGAIAAWRDFLRVDPTGERSAMAKAELEELNGLAK
jgi:cytochrome c-type biogenesis protein CcmH/NrfG